MPFQEILRAEVAVDPRRVWRHLGGVGKPRIPDRYVQRRAVGAVLRRVAPEQVADPWLTRRLRRAELAVFVLAAADVPIQPADRSDPFARTLEHAVACAALRELVESLEGRLRDACAPLELSRRWSPGTMGWELASGQRQVFALLDASALGVRLRDSGCMEPAHAWSMVYGFGSFAGRRQAVSECAACVDLRCPIRAGEGAA